MFSPCMNLLIVSLGHAAIQKVHSGKLVIVVQLGDPLSRSSLELAGWDRAGCSFPTVSRYPEAEREEKAAYKLPLKTTDVWFMSVQSDNL